MGEREDVWGQQIQHLPTSKHFLGTCYGQASGCLPNTHTLIEVLQNPMGQGLFSPPLFFFLFFFLATPCGMWDLSSPTRYQTRAPCSGSAES